MNIPEIKDLVASGNVVRFSRYHKNELWYDVCRKSQWVDTEAERSVTGEYHYSDSLFEFPVPIDDTGDGIFLAEDKAMLFMRYIRKHIAYLRTATN